MGCDIHLVIEGRKIGSKDWIGLWSSGVCPQSDSWSLPTIRRRDYVRFGELAQVRIESKTGHEPRGAPDDISDLTRLEITRWGEDGHSHTWLTPEEFIAACERALKIHRRRTMGSAEEAAYAEKFHWERFAVYELFGIDTDVHNDMEFRIVFWFDN